MKNLIILFRYNIKCLSINLDIYSRRLKIWATNFLLILNSAFRRSIAKAQSNQLSSIPVLLFVFLSLGYHVFTTENMKEEESESDVVRIEVVFDKSEALACSKNNVIWLEGFSEFTSSFISERGMIGSYYLVFKEDTEFVASESNENNNISTVNIEMCNYSFENGSTLASMTDPKLYNISYNYGEGNEPLIFQINSNSKAYCSELSESFSQGGNLNHQNLDKRQCHLGYVLPSDFDYYVNGQSYSLTMKFSSGNVKSESESLSEIWILLGKVFTLFFIGGIVFLGGYQYCKSKIRNEDRSKLSQDSNFSKKEINHVKGIIALARLDDALAQLEEKLRLSNRQTYNEIILLQNRLNELKKYHRTGTISYNEMVVIRNNITFSTLLLLDQIEIDNYVGGTI